MNIPLFAIAVFFINVAALNNLETRTESSAIDENFEEGLEKGYQLLKSEPDADETKKLLQHLHYMKPEIKQEPTLSAEQKAELQEAIKIYEETKKYHIDDTIEEINAKANIDKALYQGDMLLTREQAEEVIRDAEENSVKRNKRQAYRDKLYPKRLWSNGVYYSFYSNVLQDKPIAIEDMPEDGHKINRSFSLIGYLSLRSKSNQTNYNYNLTYDYGGVMHYGATGASKNGKPIMVPHDIKYLATLGSPMISFYETLMMNLHYKCLDKCAEGTSAKCQNGGFPHPRNCSKCICPSGYGGDLCNERPSGCGKTLKATDSYQTLEDVVGESGLIYGKDEFNLCNYWIEAPAGSTIEVVFVSYTDRVSTDGCRFAGVEIKTGSDKRHTGYRFCSPKYAGTSLVSAYNIVPVITYSRIFKTKTVLFYRIAFTSTGSPGTTISTTPPRPATTSDPRCQDSIICIAILKLGFCSHPKYDDNLRKKVCPKSCGFC